MVVLADTLMKLGITMDVELKDSRLPLMPDDLQVDTYMVTLHRSQKVEGKEDSITFKLYVFGGKPVAEKNVIDLANAFMILRNDEISDVTMPVLKQFAAFFTTNDYRTISYAY